MSTTMDKQSPVTASDEPEVRPESARGKWAGAGLRSLPPITAMFASIIGAVLSLQLWNAHLGVPFEYGGDSLSHAMHLEQIIQNGWVWNDDRLGAPFIQHMQDWPMGDVLSLVTGWVLALFTSNWAVVQNGIFLLSFPLASLSCWWALKKLSVSTWTAVVMGILFSLLPYHFVRGEQHLFLSNYYVVPLGVLLAVKLLDGQQLFSSTRRFRSRGLKFLSLQTVQTVAMCVLLGLGGIYYGAFTLLFVAVAVAIRLMQTRSWRSLAPGIVVACIIAGTTLVATAPAIIYHQQHGPNATAGVRQASESDVYGLKLAQMLAPTPGHRIDSFDDYQQRYLDTFPLPGERGSAALGTIGALGLLWLLGLAVTSLVRPPAVGVQQRRQRQFAIFAIIGLIVASVGGLSTVIGLLFIQEIRSWNRMSIFIAVCALGAVGLLLDRGIGRIRRNVRPFATAAILATVAVVGFLDQTGRQWVPSYAAVDAAYFQDQKFFGAIEAELPDSAAVYVMPAMEFPEAAPLRGIASNDNLQPYLNTNDIRWSFGGVKGRVESQWQDRLNTQSMSTLAFDLAAVGYQGIYIDRRGYADNAVTIESELQQLLGVQPLVNADRTNVFYDLRSYADRLRSNDPAAVNSRHEALLHPVAVVGAKKFFGEETDGKRQWRWADGTQGTLIVENASSAKQRSRVQFELLTATGAPAAFSVKWPDGQVEQVTVANTPVTVGHELLTTEGGSEITVSSNAQRLTGVSDTRDLRFQVANLDVAPAS